MSRGRVGTTHAMVLPAVDPTSGTARVFAYSPDERVPTPLPSTDWTDREAQQPRVVGWVDRSEQCPDGRHLFDILESTVEHEIEEELPDGSWDYRHEQDFRARLTCVRCGHVRQWEGRRTQDRHVATLATVPLVVGDLVAQMVHTDRIGRQDWSRYDVFRSTATGLKRIGALTPARGSRGREYFVGQLDAWGTGPGTYVEGKDAISALRAISRRERQSAELAGASR